MNILTKRLELRQLYVPLRIKPQTESDNEAFDPRLMALEGDNLALAGESILKQNEILKKTTRISIGERLDESRHIVILGDPGSGKTTLLRWLSTAYLLYQKESSEVEFFLT